jgi:hypothetical protein
MKLNELKSMFRKELLLVGALDQGKVLDFDASGG